MENIKNGDFILIDKEQVLKKEVDSPNDLDGNSVEVNVQEFGQVYLVMDRDYKPIRIRFNDDSIYDIDKEDIIKKLTTTEYDLLNVNLIPSGVVFEFKYDGEIYYVSVGVDFDKEKVYNNPNIDLGRLIIFDCDSNRVDYDNDLYPILEQMVITQVIQ